VLTVSDSPERIAALLSAQGDLRDAGGVRSLVTNVAERAAVEVELADE
jgi:hypothetical protein